MRTIFAEYNPETQTALMFIPLLAICSALTVGKLKRT